MRVEGHEVAEGLHVQVEGGLAARLYRFKTGRNPTMAYVKMSSSYRLVTVAESRRIVSQNQKGHQA